MKQGNQFYLAIEITDADDKIIDIENISKIQFTFNDVLKIYDGEKDEVVYDNELSCFKVYFSEEDTFDMDYVIDVDCRILFKNSLIDGCEIQKLNVYKSLGRELLDV